MSPQEFYDRCAQHDWYYDYSDDGSVWRAGRADRSEIERLAHEHGHEAILAEWTRHMFSGQPWGTDKAPRPERPGGPSHAERCKHYASIGKPVY